MMIRHKFHTLKDLFINRPHTIPGVIFGKIAKTGIFNFLDDEKYQRIQYRMMLGKKLNLTSPTTFNEKLQWLKINNRKSEYTKMVDKYEVRTIISNSIGSQYLVPLLNVYNNVEEIAIENLPEQFVLKCTHDSGSVFICKDKSTFDWKQVKEKLNIHMKRNLFWWAREWPYKNVKPRIIAEQYMKDENSENLPVYKFLCFNGEPKIIQVIQNDKQPNESIDYFDVEWNLLPFRQDYPNSEIHFNAPTKLEEMLFLATKLSKGLPFVRVDFYSVNGGIYFSEFTMYSDAGMARFYPYDWDRKLGEWIDLSGI